MFVLVIPWYHVRCIWTKAAVSYTGSTANKQTFLLHWQASIVGFPRFQELRVEVRLNSYGRLPEDFFLSDLGTWIWVWSIFFGECQAKYIIANNLPANDSHWDSDDPGWVGKASMSKRHRFLIRRNLHWRWFNALVFGHSVQGAWGTGLKGSHNALSDWTVDDRGRVGRVQYSKQISLPLSSWVGNQVCFGVAGVVFVLLCFVWPIPEFSINFESGSKNFWQFHMFLSNLPHFRRSAFKGFKFQFSNRKGEARQTENGRQMMLPLFTSAVSSVCVRTLRYAGW